MRTILKEVIDKGREVKKIKIILLIFLVGIIICNIFVIDVFAEEIYIEKMERNSVEYSFSDARFVDYEGKEALSVDLTWYVNTSFLPRTIPLASIKLHYRDKSNLEKKTAEPAAFNSTTFGTIFNLDTTGIFTGGVKVSDSGDKITEKEDIEGSVSSIQTDSKEAHRGSLLFFISQNSVMLYGISIGGRMTDVKKARNVYIDLEKEDVNINTIYEVLREVKIPATGHILLGEIYDSINKFSDLNEVLESAW